MDFDIHQQIQQQTDVKYLQTLSGYVDIDISNIEKDVNKTVELMFVDGNEKKYQRNKRKKIRFWKQIKSEIESRIKELST